MTEASTPRVWLNGQRFDVAYLLDVDSGKVVRREALPGRVGATAGVGRRCGGRFVAVYVPPHREGLCLQIDDRRFPLDGITHVRYVRHLRGIFSELIISREGEVNAVARNLTPGRFLLRRLDPAYDDLDGSVDDFLADVADIAASRERQEWMLTVKDPSAGPWHVLRESRPLRV